MWRHLRAAGVLKRSVNVAFSFLGTSDVSATRISSEVLPFVCVVVQSILDTESITGKSWCAWRGKGWFAYRMFMAAKLWRFFFLNLLALHFIRDCGWILAFRGSFEPRCIVGKARRQLPLLSTVLNRILA